MTSYFFLCRYNLFGGKVSFLVPLIKAVTVIGDNRGEGDVVFFFVLVCFVCVCVFCVLCVCVVFFFFFCFF